MVKSMLEDAAAGRPCPRIGPTALLLLFAAAVPASGQVATISIVDSAGDVGGPAPWPTGPWARAHRVRSLWGPFGKDGRPSPRPASASILRSFPSPDNPIT